VNDERVQIVGEALRRGGVAGTVEFVDQGPEPLLAVALAGGVIERLPGLRGSSRARRWGG
jgi:hypothetical protein